jgi:hypothetical protein
MLSLKHNIVRPNALHKLQDVDIRFWDHKALQDPTGLWQPLEHMQLRNTTFVEQQVDAAEKRIEHFVRAQKKSVGRSEIVSAWHTAHQSGLIREAEADVWYITSQCSNNADGLIDRFTQMFKCVIADLEQLDKRYRKAIHGTFVARQAAYALGGRQAGAVPRVLSCAILANGIEHDFRRLCCVRRTRISHSLQQVSSIVHLFFQLLIEPATWCL